MSGTGGSVHGASCLIEQMLDTPTSRVSLSSRSSAELCHRIDRLVADFVECNREDSQLDLSNRRGYSLIVAMRPWLMPAFAAMKRS